MILDCHVILWIRIPRGKHHLAKFGAYGDMFLVVGGQDSLFSVLNPLLLFISKKLFITFFMNWDYIGFSPF